MVVMAKREYPYLQVVLSNNVKTARNRVGFSQQKLAELSGISTNFVAAIESARKFPSPENLERLAASLGVKPYQLLYDGPSESLELTHVETIVTHHRNTLIEQITRMTAETIGTLGK